ncbi:MAG: metallophosphoesterase family protein [Sedimentisphaerales bacterium]|nr:metallophosphoesterase family protein [Sedimentisphaerales bacterium]
MHEFQITGLDDRKLYIISDLHIGNGSSHDNLIKGDKYVLLNRFLDDIENQNGVLLILGDFMELWRYSWADILTQWRKLLDRLAGMDVLYVPGNHDDLLAPCFAECRQAHRFFDKLHKPFIKTIANKRVQFMHGHEIDPMISRYWTTFSPAVRFLAGTFELGTDYCLITSDTVSDFLLETGEKFLRIWKTLTRQANRTIFSHLGFSCEPITWLRCPVRTRNMLVRFYEQQTSGLYDITITGHTHQAGYFGNWYFNSGCWTRHIVNYLTVYPDGNIEVRNWTPEGSSVNTSIVACSDINK